MFDQPISERRNVPESKPTPLLGIGVALLIVAVVAYVIKNSRQSEMRSIQPTVTTNKQY